MVTFNLNLLWKCSQGIRSCFAATSKVNWLNRSRSTYQNVLTQAWHLSLVWMIIYTFELLNAHQHQTKEIWNSKQIYIGIPLNTYNLNCRRHTCSSKKDLSSGLTLKSGSDLFQNEEEQPLSAKEITFMEPNSHAIKKNTTEHSDWSIQLALQANCAAAKSSSRSSSDSPEITYKKLVSPPSDKAQENHASWSQ